MPRILSDGIEPRAELDEAMIEIGYARLERVRHRRAVDLGEKIVRQPQARVDVQQAIEIRRALGLVECGGGERADIGRAARSRRESAA